jgi:hypothetical protein
MRREEKNVWECSSAEIVMRRAGKMKKNRQEH